MRLNAGFSLIEVLVSVVILSIGLLGVAALQLAGLQYSQGAYQQSQATVAITDLIDRMRANPDLDAVSGAYVFDTEDDAIPGAQPCMATGCQPSALASQDIREWRSEILANVGSSAEATVQLAGGMYTITLSWDDVADRNSDGAAAERSMTTEVRI